MSPEVVPQIPSGFYWLVGVLVCANLGTIGTVAMIAFRTTWWFSKLDSRVDYAKETAVRAHKRIDKLEEAT